MFADLKESFLAPFYSSGGAGACCLRPVLLLGGRRAVQALLSFAAFSHSIFICLVNRMRNFDLLQTLVQRFEYFGLSRHAVILDFVLI
jgi:hypothetical protein